jgi:hypothetical protein
VDEEVTGIDAHIGALGGIPVFGGGSHLTQPELADAVESAGVARAQEQLKRMV